MALIILALLITVPIVEIMLFIEIGGRIGVWSTVAVVVLTAIAGTALLRYQGLNTLTRAQAQLDQGRFPMAELFDGLCLLAAGLVLLTPGFLTDAIGALLFLPPVRAALRRLVAAKLMAADGVHVRHGMQPGRPAQPSPHDDDIIDVDFTEVGNEDDLPPVEESRWRPPSAKDGS